MQGAVAVGLPEPAPPDLCQPQGIPITFGRAGGRIWIETLDALGLDPVPTFACAPFPDHDGLQWAFFMQRPEDLRRLSAQAARLGEVASVNSLGPATITASA
jgi:hypothetical protein